jgi:murein DD-endopeptidase MepM/ murein hydrolase activator NlpD
VASAAPAPAAASGFAAAKGRLPRPVAGSFKIVSPYGRHSKPGLDNVVYDNTGIDVEVSTGATAKAVYDGVVSGVYQADGFSHVVLIRHDNYYTVYANLGSVSVSAGQTVKQGQSLGTVAKDSEDKNRSIFHFEIWKERTRMNPSDWIR